MWQIGLGDAGFGFWPILLGGFGMLCFCDLSSFFLSFLCIGVSCFFVFFDG